MNITVADLATQKRISRPYGVHPIHRNHYTHDKSGFDNAAMTGEHPPAYNHPPAAGYGQAPAGYGQALAGYGQPQYGYNQPQGYGQPMQYGVQPPIIVAAAVPVRETGPRPDTSTSLVVSILSLIFCIGAWPFAIVAIIFNRKANSQANLGQYTAAKSALRTTCIFIGVTVFLGIIAWVIFAIRLKYTLDAIDRIESHDNYWN